jgi:hypothetical protein
MKQELTRWAVINNVTQELLRATRDDSWPILYPTREHARHRVCWEKTYRDNTNARVRKVKVTIEEAE